MYDRLIRGGVVIDGTGAPRRTADVGIQDGRIAAIGRLTDSAREVLDADGAIVAPGFIDIHTHYDAQLLWDRAATPSCFHGVTTVVGGNCGFTIAPLADDGGRYIRRMLARVEGMPLESLEAGGAWGWHGFGEYLDVLDARDGGIGINAGFLVGHSAIRRVVMGERSIGHVATAAEIEAMSALLATSIQAGGLGLSSGRTPVHQDYEGSRVPSYHANDEELFALCRVVRAHPGTTLEFAPSLADFDATGETMIRMSLEAGRPINWNVLIVNAEKPADYLRQLALSDKAAARGARVVPLSVPHPMEFFVDFASPFYFGGLPGFAKVMALPIEARRRALADPAERAPIKQAIAEALRGPLADYSDFARMEISKVHLPKNAGLVGRKVGDVARERGLDAVDALLDIALSDELKTLFVPVRVGADDASWKARGEILLDPRVVVGASDAGAHLDIGTAFAYSTKLLAEGVRQRGIMTLEQAVQQLAQVPARLYGFKDRGELREGMAADLVVFDAARVDRGPVESRADLPGGASRLYAEAIGVEAVAVAGVDVVRGGKLTGARPGRVLRSGRDTVTVEVPGAARA
ncbi:MAG: amidohydrolase family protein [Deltaproteobacteria bacterium]|nr:amidohydrolase family protein [Deltaproteobacteria bacterium]